MWDCNDVCRLAITFEICKNVGDPRAGRMLEIDHISRAIAYAAVGGRNSYTKHRNNTKSKTKSVRNKFLDSCVALLYGWQAALIAALLPPASGGK